MIALRTQSGRDLARAKHALIERYHRLGGRLMGGYTPRLEDNLLRGVPPDAVHDLAQTTSYEHLSTRLRAVYSAAALTLNSFGPWRLDPAPLPLAGQRGFASLRFEHCCSSDLGGIPQALDVLLTGHAGQVIAIESTFLDHLNPIEPVATAHYERIRDHRRDTPWFREVQELAVIPLKYEYFDAAHLVHHALGLAYHYPTQPLTLMYLYWEPTNWSEHEVYCQHREEVERFAAKVAGTAIRFLPLSYPELWQHWQADPAMLPFAPYLGRLTSRYLLEV